MKNPFLVLSLVLALSVSCVRELTLDPGEEPMVVVDCVLFDESPQTLRLFYSRPPAYSEMTPITEAEVELIDKTDGKTAGMFVHQEGREWTLDYSAVPEHEYRLEVRVPGHDLVYAEDTMPASPAIRAITWTANMSSGSSPNYEKYGNVFTGTVFEISTLPPFTWIYALNYNRETGKHEIAEEICTDFPWVDNFNLTGEAYAPELEPHDYPFDFLGPAKSYPYLEGTALHWRFLRIVTPDGFDNEDQWPYFIISGSFKGNYYRSISSAHVDGRPGPEEGYIVCSSMSENYDRYLRDAMRLEQMQVSTDMSTVYCRDNVHSNIVGGIGIFGARTQQLRQWNRGQVIFGD